MNDIYFPRLRLHFMLAPYFEVLGWRVHWYGVIIGVGFLLAVTYALTRAKRYSAVSPVSQDAFIDLVLWGVPLAIVGARLYYVAFSGAVWTFTQVLQIWNGGLAIYGGIIGAGCGILIATLLKRGKNKQFAVAPYLDLTALGFLIGQAIGRWGNFVNREAFGTFTSLPWGMAFGQPTDGAVWVTYHPTFLYECLWNVLGFALLHWRSKHRRFDGEIAILYLAWYGSGRMFIEQLRTDSLLVPYTQLRVSQLLAAACIIAATVIYALVQRRISRPIAPRIATELELAAETVLDTEFASAIGAK